MSRVRVTMPGHLGISKRIDSERRRECNLKRIADATPILTAQYTGMRDLSRLPHDKNLLVQAFLNEIANHRDRRTVDGLSHAVLRLALFQVEAEKNPFTSREVSPDLADELDDETFLRLANENQRLIAAQRADIERIANWIDRARGANPHLLPKLKKFWHWLMRKGAYSGFDNDFIEIPYLSTLSESNDGETAETPESNPGQKAFPETAATPDLGGAEPFFQQTIGEYVAVGFEDISPIGKRQSGNAVVEYPFVLAVLDPVKRRTVFMVTSETGLMYDTSKLCGFSQDGRHLNYGDWNPSAGREPFIERALQIATRHLL